ncbi:DUF3833 family protein [Alphaproteobacteria bacterium GH1-50]|uniref:DUF3833 family protein n=1 Tax=Kangsaoukella pontilimi TaxID=2691042 RepID=A0A7C9NEF8_9RHOB|nr:DUF3833 family protein [Kangsaoukella pontilimi]MXQ08139.1 DUF3833 family protein [Kangsaoukella pontilimi]
MELVLAFLLGLILALGAFWLRANQLGFAAQVPAEYRNGEPPFDIRQVLNGPMACEGVIFGPTGRVSSRFVAEFHASWDGDTGRMTERFLYDNGDTQDREWRLTVDDAGAIRAEADDLVGIGRGRQAGHSVMLNYRIRLPEASGGHVLDAIDWMYLTDNGTIINRSQFRKFGIKVAELVATIRPMEAVDEQLEAA